VRSAATISAPFGIFSTITVGAPIMPNGATKSWSSSSSTSMRSTV
jgi:hypothetical protein